MLTTLVSAGSRRKPAPVNGPMNGTPASVAIGCAAAEVGAPDLADQREYPVHIDELSGVGDRALGLITVVVGDELKFAPVHTPGCICLVERSLDALAHPNAQRRSRPIERGGLTEQDLVVEYARIGPDGGVCQCTEGEQPCRRNDEIPRLEHGKPALFPRFICYYRILRAPAIEQLHTHFSLRVADRVIASPKYPETSACLSGRLLDELAALGLLDLVDLKGQLGRGTGPAG